MKNILMITATLLAGIAIGVGVDSYAEYKKSSPQAPQDTLIQSNTELAKMADLKIVSGKIEDHTDPESVVKRAITAAKEDKLAILKACFATTDHEELDKEAWGSDKKLTNLQTISKIFASFDAEKITLLKQNTVGNRAVALVTSEAGRHVVRLKLRDPDEQWSSDKEKPKGWYMFKPYNVDLFLTNYASEEMGKLREAIKSADTKTLMEYIETNETKAFELISGVKEGVDPSALLEIRLQRIMATSAKPVTRFQESGST
ncbi:MAG: hypothetical protein V3V10_05405, partial [Planctomycetota bacterium]